MDRAILILEDDLDIRACLREVLEGDGYPIVIAENGKAGLEILESKPDFVPCLILLDLMMPVMDGATFLLELKQKYAERLRKTPIFIMTARADIHQFSSQVTGLLKKPLDLTDLCQLAAKYCQRSQVGA